MNRRLPHVGLTKSGKRREVPMRQAVYDVLAGLPGGRGGRVFHDSRHHFASWFVMRGGSLQALKELLGHADLKMTLRYAHLAPDHLRDQMAKTEAQGQIVAAEPASEITQGITHERVREVQSLEDVSTNI